MAELLDVVSREKFAARFAQAGLVPMEIVGAIRRLATIAVPASVPRVITDEADYVKLLPARKRPSSSKRRS